MSRDNTVIYEFFHFSFLAPKENVPVKKEKKSSLYNATIRQKDCVCSGEIKGGEVGHLHLANDDCCIPQNFPPLQQYLRLKKENPADFSLCRACFLAYEDLHTDVFPLFWGLIIPIFGPKSLCMGIIDDKTEVKLTPLYYG